MRGSIDLDAILKANPHVDEDELKRSELLSEQLERAGLEPVGYRLASPLDARRIHASDTKGQRRTVRLRAL